MATAFIIRPFGTKQGVDFNRVENLLIGPALAGHKLLGRTTADALKQGNIRTDMFYRLLTADVVIVDISINNANVFYELGIRHALRSKRTFMIRASGVPPAAGALVADDVPFDLKTDRYLAYPHDDPAAALTTLKEALGQTLDSQDKDSPVFQLLPDLQEQDRASFLSTPIEFQEEVGYAAVQSVPRYRLGDLRLLQKEAMSFQWQITGLRIVGRAQLKAKAYEHARDTWEAIRRDEPQDKEANIWLGTIYQRLKQPDRATATLRRVLDNPATTAAERAEAHALLGRMRKDQWLSKWNAAPEGQRRQAALRSPLLTEAYTEYLDGFREDLNHYYSGINALGLLLTQVALAQEFPEIWAETFEEEDQAALELKKLTKELTKLQGSVTLSVEAAQERLERAGKTDLWLTITAADLACLVSAPPKKIARLYEAALEAADAFSVDSVRQQLRVYEQLGVAAANVAEILITGKLNAAEAKKTDEAPDHVLLFTGHRIDAPGREKPRFPADKEAVARQAIEQAVRRETAGKPGPFLGLAGGANGGDILFHEVCAELGIPTLLYLAMPREGFVRESVADAGPEWVARFDRLHAQLPTRLLGTIDELPAWLKPKPDYGIWQRNNLWMLYNALALGSAHVTLIALWDGEPTGNGPGGTQDMVAQAQAGGAAVQRLPTKTLFGLEHSKPATGNE
jgi:hypothetical protein